MPDTRPANGATPDAVAMPRHSGSATKNTTTPAKTSLRNVENDKDKLESEDWDMIVRRRMEPRRESAAAYESERSTR